MNAILNRRGRVLQVAAAMLPLVAASCAARADIFQWEYTNAGDSSQGKKPSTTLALDGAGVSALPGANLNARNLTMAFLIGADLMSADGQGANLTGADLTNSDLRESNFSHAYFINATLKDADLDGAEVRRALFNCSGITLAQLYSTTSYQNHDLSGIGLSVNDLSGGNFVGQNLTNADFYDATLRDADFRQANLTNANFSYAALSGAGFTAADARGALFYPYSYSAGANTTNLILPGGHIDGLDLDAGGLLVVRDYDGNPTRTNWFDGTPAPLPPIPISVDKHLMIGAGGTLRTVFETDEWNSTISFAPGIPLSLGGTLELTFASDVNLGSQIGRTFDLFDWTGVNSTGVFAISSPYTWDLSRLYTSGEVTLTAIPEPRALLLFSFALFVPVVIGRGQLFSHSDKGENQ